MNAPGGGKFPLRGLQPGMLCGRYGENGYEEIFSGTASGNNYLANMVKEDMVIVGKTFVPYTENLSEGYKVALVVRNDDVQYSDYHWYRDNGDGTWSHKPGQTEVTNKVTVLQSNGLPTVSNDVVTDPREAGQLAGYNIFVGYYYVK